MNKLYTIGITILLMVTLTSVSSSVAGDSFIMSPEERDKCSEIRKTERGSGVTGWTGIPLALLAEADTNRKADGHIKEAKKWFKGGWTYSSDYHFNIAITELLKEQNRLLRKQIKLLEEMSVGFSDIEGNTDHIIRRYAK